LPVDDGVDAGVNERHQIEENTQLVDSFVVAGQSPLDDGIQQETRAPADEKQHYYHDEHFNDLLIEL